METSEDVTDETILTQIQPTTVLSWARARVALQLADSASDWATIFSYYHSGTRHTHTTRTHICTPR